MNLTEPLVLSLKAVVAVMRDARDPWWIIASAAVALHGADAGPVADVDVLVGIRDAMRILPTIGIEPGPGTDHPDFRSSIFGTWREPPLAVEFMAGFCHRSGGGWRRVQPTTRHAVTVDGVTVYVPDRAELHRMLVAFGRPKDVARARHLATLG